MSFQSQTLHKIRTIYFLKFLSLYFLKLFYSDILFLHFLIISCGNDLDTINSPQIVIKYDSFNFNKIEEDDFFLIDNIKFIHKKYHTKNISENSYILPTPNFIIRKVEGKNFYEKTNPIELSFKIYEILINKDYEISDLKNIQINGELKIKRIDNKKISIKKNKHYPLIINEK